MKTDTINNNKLLDNRIQNSYFEKAVFDMLKSEIIEKPLDFVDKKQYDQEIFDTDTEDGEILLEVINQQANSKHKWQITSACLVTYAIILSFICSWLFIGQANQITKIEKTEAKLQKSNYDFTQADQKIKTLENQMTKLDLEHKNAQDELIKSRAEIEILQAQLSDANQRIKSLLNRNEEVVKRLSERLQKLSDQPLETMNP